MNYLYNLKPVSKHVLRRIGVARHEMTANFVLPTWAAEKIERKTLDRFARYRIQYYPGIRPAFFHVIRKVGISKNPDRRISEINNDWRSGRTEYVELNYFVACWLAIYIYTLWAWYTVLIPSIILSLIIISYTLFVLL